jgi:hypothetical protein
MISFRSSTLCIPVLAVAASAGCSRDATFVEPTPALAAIHWVHAVPDTMQEDFRVVDIVSNAGLFDQDFRGSNMFYQGIEVGSRHVIIFNSSTDPTIAQQVMKDTIIDFAATDSITLIHMGFARAGSTPARRLRLFTDKAPDPAGTNIGFRAIHAGGGMPNLDVNLIRHRADTLTLPATPLIANLAFGTASTYLTVPADAAAADSLRVVVTAAGTTTPILANVALPPGEAGDVTKNPIAGARVARSVVTAVLVPRSVAGSAAPQGFTTPSAVILVDRRPPDTVP